MEELIDNKMSRNVEQPFKSFCKVLPSHLTAWVRKTRKHFKTWFLTNLPCNTLINCHRKQILYCPISKQGWCRVKKKLLHCVTVWPATVSHNVSHNATFFLDILNIAKVVKITFFSLLLSLCVTLILHLTKFWETPARHVQCSKDHFWISLSCGG